MNVRQNTVAALALAAGTILVAAPANAATEVTTYAYQGSDYAAIVGATGDGYVADKECDGHRVRVQVTGRRFSRYVYDTNGCDVGVGRFDFSDGMIDALQVQEEQPDGTWSGGTRVAVQ